MRVSVVIPAYNVEKWLAEAIRSALVQDPKPYEVIVVDDGSTDGSGRIASDFGTDVRLISQTNQGLAATRNRGAEEASGEVICFLDADDQLHPAFLHHCTARLADSSVAAVVPNALLLFDGARSTPLWRAASDSQTLTRPSLRRLIWSNRLQPNSLVRRDVWERVRFDPHLRSCEDLDFWLRTLLGEGSIALVGRPLVSKREGRPDALSNNVLAMRTHRRLVFEKLLQDPRLTPAERALLHLQLTKTALGEQVLLDPQDPSSSEAMQSGVQSSRLGSAKLGAKLGHLGPIRRALRKIGS